MAGPEPRGKVYWRSLDELTRSPEFLEIAQREFPAGVDEAPDEVSRRGFLSIVAASVALAGMTSCRKPAREILPFTRRPEGFAPGIPSYYATTYVSGGYGYGTLVKSSDGRPTKVEGNALHPCSLGGSNQFQQADLLNLYDPARSKAVRHGHPEEDAAHAEDEEHADEEAGDPLEPFMAWWSGEGTAAVPRGQGLRLLMPPSTSPALQDTLQKLGAALPEARAHTWAPLHRDEEIEGARLAYGQPLDTHYHLDRAEVVASFDCDFLSLDGDALKNARNWARKRRITGPDDRIARLYAAESNYSVTGSMADHRFRLRSHEIADAVFALAAALGVGGGGALGEALGRFSASGFRYRDKEWIGPLARDLQANRGASCVMVGPRQPAVVHAVAHAINTALGNVGQTVTYTATAPSMASSQVDSLRALVADMNAGQVDTLVCLGCNPVYDAPADLEFATALEKVAHTVHLGVHDDETGAMCEWHLPQTHDLEAWGDIRARDGTLSFVQPLIAPLYHGISSLELVARLAGEAETEGYQILRSYWQDHAEAEDFSSWWNRALHDGVVPDSTSATVSPSLAGDRIAGAVSGRSPSSAGSLARIEVVFEPDPSVLDGRFSNNPWLMEMPDPLTKLTWDNAALVSPRTAEELDADNGDLIALEVDGRTLEAPVWILPGHADHSVTLGLGYGRRLGADHKVAEGAGVDAYRIRTSSGQHMAIGSASNTGRRYELVSTQGHQTMVDRPLVREGTVDGFRADPDFAPMQSPLARLASLEGKTEADLNKSLWEERGYSPDSDDPEVRATPYQWGMVIDLNACTGCSACIVACISENNVATVGKRQVARSREMLWLRSDRYFSADDDPSHMSPDEDPQVVHQPVPCQQCENAPCESVCPVMATSHSPEGLNDMAYNRCIGTRYCSNNCPYKVRRFNWFDFHGRVPEVKKMTFNPDVTVRSRGVMEKCTYCVQRINRGKADAKLEGRQLRDGEVTTACAQACPTEAITFGNILDLDSNVARLKSSPLNYTMLSERNLKPRTSYLAKIRNPNPELA